MDECSVSNGGCEHSCDYDQFGYASCSCEAGYILASNKKTCNGKHVTLPEV